MRNQGLIVVHNNGLIHRDVHPGNILLRKRDGKLEAVLIDFGLALDFDHILTTSRTQETSEGFTPPELYARGAVKHTSDIYSLAATLYKLLTGLTPVSALERVDGEHLVSPKEYNSQISDRTNQAILTGMKLDPKQRSQSMREWLNSLGLTGENLQPAPTVTSNTNSNWEKKIQIWGVIIAAIAAIGTLLSGIAGWIPFFPKPSPSPTPTLTSPPSSKTP